MFKDCGGNLIGEPIDRCLMISRIVPLKESGLDVFLS